MCMQAPYHLVDELEPGFGRLPPAPAATPDFTVNPPLQEIPALPHQPLSWIPDKQGPRSGVPPRPPIHRAMSRMLHADERYENRAFMPAGQFVAEEPAEGHE